MAGETRSLFGPKELRRIGHQVRMARERERLTQNQVANAAGISPRAIRELEAGRSNPALATIVAIVDQLDLTLDELVEAARSAPPGPDITRAADVGDGETALVRTLADPRMRSRIVRQSEPTAVAPHPGVPHPGNAAFYHVLAGTIAVDVDGHALRLKRGDSLHVDAGVDGSWRAEGGESRVLIVEAGGALGAPGSVPHT